MMPILQITPEAAKRMFRGFRFPPNKSKPMKYENTPMAEKAPPRPMINAPDQRPGESPKTL
jgi:hypothetical protein